MSTPISYGTKYAATKDLRVVEIAKLVRADIKAAVAAGELPKAKYSVTSDHNSIDVRVSHVEKDGFVLANAERVIWDHEQPHAGLYNCPSEVRWLYSAEAREVLSKIDLLTGAYNYDGSDSQSDYFNVRFYGHAQYAHAWADERTEGEKATILATHNAPKSAANDVAPESNAQEDFLAAMGAF